MNFICTEAVRESLILTESLIHVSLYIYDPGFRVRGPPPPNGLGPPRRRERSSRLVCVEASQHALDVYIHTHRLYIHTYILTDKYIHTPIHACTYRHAPPTHRGAGHTIHTHIHTYIQIHTYIHTCMYIQTRPPNPQGGAGGRPLVPPTYKKGGWGLQTWTIYIIFCIGILHIIYDVHYCHIRYTKYVEYVIYRVIVSSLLLIARCQVQPPIFFMPAKHTRDTEKQCPDMNDR